MNYDEFVNTYNGKATDYDGGYGVQCVDLIKLYLDKVFGIKAGAWGNAHAYFDNYNNNTALKNNFNRIANTASFVPIKGDIVVWNTKQGNGAGHIAIATGEGNTSYFYSYDQNWGKKAMTKVKHTYTNVSGVLRAKDQTKINGVQNSSELFNIDKYFDANLYFCLYKDLQKAYGMNINLLKEHFKIHGLKEGRISSYVFDPVYYINKYSDLKAAFGTNYIEAYKHFINNGIKEGRQASQIFDPIYYINKYPDLKAAFGTNYEAAYNHFITYGMNEGRQASSEFNCTIYKNRYGDLQKAFGNNNKEYYKHWYMYGKKEGRKCI